MLDRLPPELLATVISRLGERPEQALRTCRSTWLLVNDTPALLLWLQQTFGCSGAIFTLTSVRCVARWDEDRILGAVKQLLSSACNLGDTETKTQMGCVLYWATKQGMARVLDVLLSHVAQPTWQNSLLKTAAAQGHEGCVRVLLAKGADPNVDAGRPLKAATEAGCAGCVQALIDAGADLHAAGECALRLCAAAGSPAHVQVMALLLQRGADVHAKADEALSLAVERSNAEAVALLLQHGANASARQVLETAASTGCARVVRLLLAHGAPPDADGGRPLRAAAEAGAVEVVRQLLDAGARCGNGGGAGGGPGRRSMGHRPPTGRATGTGTGLGRPSVEIPARNSTAFADAGLYGSCGTGGGGVLRPSSWHSGAAGMAGTGTLVGPGSGAGVPAQRTIGWPLSDTADSKAASSGSESVASCTPRAAAGAVVGVATGSTGEAGGSGPTHSSSAGSFDLADVLFDEEQSELKHPSDSTLPEEEENEEELECGAGGEALCAALCAGEAEVVRVLIERGAKADIGALRCWRQWHRYPGIMAVLQRHRPLGENPARLPQPPPLASPADTRPARAAPAPPGGPHPPWGQWMDPFLSQPRRTQPAGQSSSTSGAQSSRMQSARQVSSSNGAQTGWGLSHHPCQDVGSPITAARSAWAGKTAPDGADGAGELNRLYGGRETCTGTAGLPLLQQQLREALVASAGEGADAAVRLFLTWGAPTVGAVDVLVALQNYATQAASRTSSQPLQLTPTEDFSLGCFTPECLSNALAAAAATNRRAIVQQLLGHKAGHAWSSAVMHPAALHAAVAEGHQELVRLLLEAGAAPMALERYTNQHQQPLQPLQPPPHVTHTASSHASMPCTHADKPVLETVSPSQQASSPGVSQADSASVFMDCSSMSAALPKATGHSPLTTTTTVQGNTSCAEINGRFPAVNRRFPPPPPPLQDESWGTVVLCAAASCKAGSKTAALLTAQLLQHGFTACARDALRLVACGRVPTWRDEPTGAILTAAFAGYP